MIHPQGGASDSSDFHFLQGFLQKKYPFQNATIILDYKIPICIRNALSSVNVRNKIHPK